MHNEKMKKKILSFKILLFSIGISLFSFFSLTSYSIGSVFESNEPIRRYAIVIGIDYQPPYNLDYTIKDAQEVAKALENFDFEVRLLTKKEETTRKHIMREFELLRQKVNENDQIIVFYSGHGVRDPDNPEIGYLIPYDGNRKELLVSSIPMSTIQDISRIIKARHMLFIIDACFSGIIGGFNIMDIPEQKGIDWVKTFLGKRARQVLTAGSSYETALMRSDIEMSVFSFYIKQGLSKENGHYRADLNHDYLITIGELHEYLMNKVIKETGDKQHPKLFDYTADDGRFVFVPKEYNEIRKIEEEHQKIRKSERVVKFPKEKDKYEVEVRVKKFNTFYSREPMNYLEFKKFSSNTLLLIVGRYPSVIILDVRNGTILERVNIVGDKRISLLDNKEKFIFLEGTKIFSLKCKPCISAKREYIFGLSQEKSDYQPTKNILYIWNPAKNKIEEQHINEEEVFLRELRLKEQVFQVSDIAISPKGNFVAAQSHQNIAKIWNAKTGEEIATIRTGKQSSFYSNTIAFSKDERYLAISMGDVGRNEPRVLIYDLYKRKIYATFGQTEVKNIVFSPDNNYIVVVGKGWRKSVVEIWNINKKEKVLTLEVPESQLYESTTSYEAAAISPDNKYLALSNSKEKEIEIWRIYPHEIKFLYRMIYLKEGFVVRTHNNKYIVPQKVKDSVYFVKGFSDYSFDEFKNKYTKEAKNIILNLEIPIEKIDLLQ